MNEKQLAAVHRRMGVWFALWVIAILCGLPPFDHTTVFWVSVITVISINKER
jgi:membrane protease YdiL (CAAX protease family)